MAHFLEHFLNEQKVDLDWAQKAIVHGLFTHVKNMSSDTDKKKAGLIGLDNMLRRMIQGVILGDHILLEGNPGVAKSLASEVIANMLGLVFKRVQFTPDMMPSDIVGSERIQVKGGKQTIEWCYGAGFTNVLLADEINRSSPKSQAFLLELCAEGKASIPFQGEKVIRPVEPLNEFSLLRNDTALPFGATKPNPETKALQQFTVFATTNPIEQEGVYPLAEAQLDRFIFKLLDDYPPYQVLHEISLHAFQQRHASLSTEEQSTPKKRQERHLRTLCFLDGLRQAIFSSEAQQSWSRQFEERGPVMGVGQKVINFLDCTHGFGDKHGEGVFARQSRKQMELERRIESARTTSPRAAAVYSLLSQWRHIDSGASPRAVIKFIRAGFAEAFWNHNLNEYGAVEPKWEDFRAVAHDVLRHRIKLDAGVGNGSGDVEEFISELLTIFDD